MSHFVHPCLCFLISSWQQCYSIPLHGPAPAALMPSYCLPPTIRRVRGRPKGSLISLFCFVTFYHAQGRAHSSTFVFSIAGNIAGICFGGACIQDNRLQFKTVRAFPSFHTVRYTYSVFMNSNSARPVRVSFLHIHHTVVHPHAYDPPYKGSGLAACGSLPHPPSEHASPVLSL